MPKGTAACISMSILAFILGVLGLCLPYWTHQKIRGIEHHAGLWRECSVSSDTFHCQNIKIEAAWIHIVQAFMVVGDVGSLLTIVLACLHRKSSHTLFVARLYAFLSVISGMFLGAAVLIYGLNNKQNSSYFNAGFYLAMLSAFFSFLASVMSYIGHMHETRVYSGGYTRIGF